MTYNEVMDAWRHSDVLTASSRRLSRYEKRKALARCIAQEWQWEFEHEYNYDFWELCKCSAFFENVGKRYGLLQEFRENGIC